MATNVTGSYSISAKEACVYVCVCVCVCTCVHVNSPACVDTNHRRHKEPPAKQHTLSLRGRPGTHWGTLSLCTKRGTDWYRQTIRESHRKHVISLYLGVAFYGGGCICIPVEVEFIISMLQEAKSDMELLPSANCLATVDNTLMFIDRESEVFACYFLQIRCHLTNMQEGRRHHKSCI